MIRQDTGDHWVPRFGVLLATFALALLSGCARSVQHHDASGTPSASPSASATPSQSPYAGWKTFTSEAEGATFQYPPDWTLTVESTYGPNNQSEEIKLKAPDGYVIGWSANVTGIGGGCDVNSTPHVFVDRLLQMPSTGYQHELAVGLFSVERRKSLAVIDTTSPWAHVGDTGDCLIYPQIQSRFGTARGLVFFSTGAMIQFRSGEEPNDGSELVTDDEYLQRADIQTTLQIFRSLRY